MERSVVFGRIERLRPAWKPEAVRHPVKNPYHPLANLFADPAHIILARLLVKMFGSFVAKSYFNVLPRGGYAYGLLRAVELAEFLGINCFTAAEFGVASGRGLDCLCRYREKVQSSTGMTIDVMGFDTGSGMPAIDRWEDHPEMWQQGDYPATVDLKKTFENRATIFLGDLARDPVPPPKYPILFASVDVDSYSSSRAVLNYVQQQAGQFCSVYFDDIEFSTASEYRGQLLAIKEFNEGHPDHRCFVMPDRMLPSGRLIRYAVWYKHMYIFQRAPAEAAMRKAFLRQSS
jgi:hypothetical protein